MTELFCQNIERFRTNQPLINLVDKKLGFPEANSILFQA